MFRGFLTITFVTLFVQQSLSSLSKDELHKAVDGFDSFFEPPRSNDAKDKEDFITTDVAPEVATFRPLEDVPGVSTKKPERVIPVREEVVEEEIVTEKAKCVVGCLINLNVSNPDLIQFAKDSLKSVPNGNNFELVQLIQAVREPTSLLGSQTQVSNNDAYVKEIAKYAVAELENLSNTIYRLGLVRIHKASKQIVAGTLTQLDLEIGETDCRKSQPRDSINHCVVRNSENVNTVCSVKVWDRPWIPKKMLLHSNCSGTNGFSIRNIRKRETSDHLVGGFSEADKNDPQTLELAKFGMQEANKKINGAQYKVIEVLSVKTQVVAGVKYNITVKASEMNCKSNDAKDKDCADNGIPVKTCTFEIWEQAWLNKKELLSHSCVDISTSSTSARNKRYIPGGSFEVNTNDPDVKKIAQIGVKEMNNRSNDIYFYKLLEILSAKKQVVSGMNYILTVRTAGTNCRKNGDRDQIIQNCAINSKLPEQICHFTIWEQSWLNKTDLTKFDCQPVSKSTRAISPLNYLPGGSFEVNTNDPDVKKIAQIGVKEMNNRSNDIYFYKLLEILSAKEQVVSGMNYILTVRTAGTNCRKNGDRDQIIQNCAINSKLPEQICHFTIWEQSWLNKTDLTKFDCQPVSKSTRAISPLNEVPGGTFEVDTNDPDVQKMAEIGVKEINNRINSLSIVKLQEILSAEKQVVSGMNYILTVKIAETYCRKNGDRDQIIQNCAINSNIPEQICHFTIWEQSWLNKTDLTEFDCQPVSRSTRAISPLNYPPGGSFEVNTNDPDVKKIAQIGVKEMNNRSNDIYFYKLLEILSAKEQVVAGMNYILTVRIAGTNCRKNGDRDQIIQNCPINSKLPEQICHFTILEQSWLNKTDLTEFDCQPVSISTRAISPLNNDIKDTIKGLSFTDEELGHFTRFMEVHKKVYKTANELTKRFRIFRANLKKINFLQENEKGTATYGLNEFADLSKQEFKAKYLGLNVQLKPSTNYKMKKAEIPVEPIPDEFDWRDHGAVTEVKNQGMCGSCWAFSVTGNIEGQWAVKTGKLVSLSEQELVDCDTLDEGCNGGLPSLAYESIEKLGGLESETDYPYDARHETCKFNKTEVQVPITGALNISTNETEMAQWLVKNGPISIGINANAMQFYMGGVSHPWKVLCSPKSLDHGVLIVGYGVHRTRYTHKLKPYWIIKNSWGKRWGEKGYYRVYRGDGTCGVNMMASSATVN